MNSLLLSFVTFSFLLHLMKRVTCEESPLAPRSDSFFEVKNWTGLLNIDEKNLADIHAELYELKSGGVNKLIGELEQNGKLYNNKEDVSLCQRRVFQLKVNDDISLAGGPLVWTPPTYTVVSACPITKYNSKVFYSYVK